MDTGGMSDAMNPTGANDDAPDPLIGRNVGRKFVLEKLLGAGAMGAVYRARQTALEKLVAIKVMQGELARDAMFAARFHREAKAASRLDHPNSIRILDYGEDDDGLLYIAMEYLDGRDLSHLIESEWPFPNARIVDLLSQALGAIAVAHDLGITHRDLKPENIMVLRRTTDDAVDIDVVKVCDFGIAKLVDASDDGAAPGSPAKGKLTTAGLVIGTPAYMSPEQGRGETIDGRSDLYSMGVILFQLLTGELPFDAPSAIGLVVKHQTEPPPLPSSIRPDVDRQLEAICLKALGKRRDDRYQTARDFRAALRLVVDTSALPMSQDARSMDGRAQDASSPRPLVSAGLTTDPEVANARTELQLAAVPTVPAALLRAPVVAEARDVTDGRGFESTRASETSPGKRSPALAIGVVVAVIASAAGGMMWSSRARSDAAKAPSTSMVTAIPPAQTVEPAKTPDVPVASTPAPTNTEPRVVPATPPAQDSPSTGERSASRHGTSPSANSPTANHTVAGVSDPKQPKSVVPAAVDSPAPPPPPVAVAPAPPTPTPAPPPPPAAPTAPAFDLAAATVVMGGATHLENITARYVNEAIGRMKPNVKRCYTGGLPTLAGALEGAGSLHIETDDSGTITAANVSGAVGGGVRTCIESTMRGVRVDGVDTGAARADIPLDFKAR